MPILVQVSWWWREGKPWCRGGEVVLVSQVARARWCQVARAGDARDTGPFDKQTVHLTQALPGGA